MKTRKTFALLVIAVLMLTCLFTMAACTVDPEYKVNFYTKTTTTGEYVYRDNLVIVAGRINIDNASAFLPDRSAQNMRFVGWYYDEELTRPFDDTVTLTGTINLYAKWDVMLAVAPTGIIYDNTKGIISWNEVANATYELTFTGVGEQAPANFIVEDVDTNLFNLNTLLSAPYNKTVADLLGSYDISIMSIVGEEESTQSNALRITLTQPVYVVEFYNGATLMDTQTVDAMGAVTVTPPTSTLAGVEFDYWFKEGANDTEINLTQVGNLFTANVVGSTIKLYAKWAGEALVGQPGEIRYGTNDNDVKEIGADGSTYYIYYAGATYDFGANVVIADSPTDPVKYYEKYGNSTIVINRDLPAGTTFTLAYTYQGEEMVRTAKVVPFVNTIMTGGGYKVYNNNKTSDTFLKHNNAYTVGIDSTTISKYYLEFDYTFGNYVTGNQLSIAFNFVLKFVDNEGIESDVGTLVEVRLDETAGKHYLHFDTDNAASLIGKVLLVKATPVYLNKAQASESNIASNTVTLTLLLNEGVNVYTHTQLKEAFVDESIACINIHANITSALDANQMNPDGSAVNTSSDKALKPNESSTLSTADVYRRVTTNTTPLTVCGNYFRINATQVARVRYSSEYSGQAKPNGPEETVQNVHISIFKLINTSNNDVRAIFNNLEIAGNTDLVGSTPAEVREYSGGHCGILAADASIDCNNVNVHHTTIAYYYHSVVNKNNNSALVDCIADINWANSIYLHGTTALTVKNGRMLTCSGATIHFEDPQAIRNNTPQYLSATSETVRNDPAFIFDTNTIIKNWITGEEAWFNAWGMSAVVAPLKSGIQSAAFTNFGMSIVSNSTGLEKINFAFMHKTCNNYSQVEIVILDGESQIKNAYTLVSSTTSDNEAYKTNQQHYGLDLRNQGGMTLVPVGDSTDTMWMLQAGAYVQYYGAICNIMQAYSMDRATAEATVAGMGDSAPAEIKTYLGLITAYGDKIGNTVREHLETIFNTYYPVGGVAAVEQAVAGYIYAGINGNFTSGNIAEAYLFPNNVKYLSLTLSGSMFQQDAAAGTGSLATVWLQFGSGDGWLNAAVAPSDD